MLAQIVTFAGSILLARLYSSQAFGYFSTFTATTSILTIISGCRYELAIPLSKKNIDSIRVFKAIIFISVCISFISLLIVVIIYLTGLINRNNLFIFLYPLFVLISAQTSSLNILHNKIGQFGKSSYGKILVSIITLLISTISSLYFKNTGLILGSFLGQLALNIYLFNALPFEVRSNLFTNFSKFSIIRVILKYISFPKHSLFPAFLNVITSQLPNYFLASSFGMSAAGLYFFSQRLISLPVALIGTALNDVIFQKVIQKKNLAEPIHSFVLKNFYFLFSVGLCFLILVWAFSGYVIPLFFGTKWTDAVIVCNIIAASSFIKLIASPLTIIFIALDDIKKSAIWQYTYFLGFILIMLILISLNVSFVNCLYVMTIYDLLLYISALFMIRNSVVGYESKI